MSIALVLQYFLQNTSQTIAATVFLATVIGTLLFWRFRAAIPFVGVVILLLTKTIDLHTTLEYMEIDVILFLMGIMVVMALLKQSDFFHWFIAKALLLSRFKPERLITLILVLAAIMAAFVDEVTAMLFISTLVIEFCKFVKMSPVKCILSVIFATNIGSSWTVLGNPISIYIAAQSGLTIKDFFHWSLPVGIISLVAIIMLSLIWQKAEIKQVQLQFRKNMIAGKDTFIQQRLQIKDKGIFKGSFTLFVIIVISLAFRHRLEIILGFEEHSLLVTIALLGAAAAMLWQRQHARFYIRDVDWWTLVFFMFLFAKAGCLQYVGLTDRISNLLSNVIGHVPLPLLTLAVLLIAGFISAAIDNIVVVTALAPIITVISTSGQILGTDVLWWALLFGTCYGGNITMAGSHANIVALGTMEEHTGHRIALKNWLKFGLPAGLVPMIIGIIALLIRS